MQNPSSSSSPARAWAPALALPFAIVGFAAGWLSDGVLANLLVDVTPSRNQLLAGMVAAAGGALLGALLSRRVASSRHELGARPLTIARLSGLVVVCGGVTGGLVGGLEMSHLWGALSGAFNGAVCAVAFVPVCALVFAAACRADRARQGSIVAGADRRAVWSILAAALAVTTLAAAIDVPPARLHLTFPAGAIMAAAAALVLVVTWLADALALRRVARLARAELEDRDPAEARFAAEVPSVNLGLGDEVRASFGRAASAYRSRASATALVLGSAGAARSALLRALLRGAAGLALTFAVLAAHRWAGTPAALVAYDEQLCDHYWHGCYEAGLLLLQQPAPGGGCPAPAALTPEDQASLPIDARRGDALLLRSCTAGDLCSCRAFEQSLQGRRYEGEGALPSWYTARRGTPVSD